MRAPALALTVLLAGCLSGPDAGESALAPANTTGAVAIGDRPDPTFTAIATGPAAAPDTTATLERPPRWVPGEWWRIEFESPLTGASVEFVRVVAAIDGDEYVVGMPHEGWYKEAVVYHAPGFGDIAVEDLSYLTHDVLFQPLKFPLTDDTTWETRFSGGPPMVATVKTDPATQTAAITFTGRSTNLLGQTSSGTILELTYDATAHEVTEFRHQTVQYRVVEHGYDFEGWVTVPRGEDLVFFHGRLGPALNFTLQPKAPIENVDVAGGFNRVSFFLATGSIAAAPGYYREYAKDPAGNEYVVQSTGGAFSLDFFEARDPDGLWELQHIAGGAGIAFIEGIAYHQYDIRLPDGARRADHSHEVVR